MAIRLNLPLISFFVLILTNCAVSRPMQSSEIELLHLPSNTVALLHGYGGSKNSWNLIANNFPEEINVEALSLVGFGVAPPPSDFGFTLQEQARYLALQFSETDNDYILVAHSMGAVVAIIAILDYELQPKRLILVDPLLYPQTTPFFIKAQTFPLVSKLTSWIVPPALQVDIVLRRIYKDFNNVNSTLRQSYINEFRKPFHRRALRRTAIALMNFDGAEYIDKFSELSMPIDIIWAKDDPLLDISNATLFRTSLPTSRLTVIENCGHAPHEECPKNFVETLLRILRTTRE